MQTEREMEVRLYLCALLAAKWEKNLTCLLLWPKIQHFRFAARDIFPSRCRSFNHAGNISDHVLSFFLSFFVSDSLPKRIELVPNTKSLASR